jgi:hypothetical protein
MGLVSMPYGVPDEDSVSIEFELESPNCSVGEFQKYWTPGDIIRAQVAAQIDARRFKLDVPKAEAHDLSIVVLLSCPESRKGWRFESNFSGSGQYWYAHCPVVVTDAVFYGNYVCEISVVGLGETYQESPGPSGHRAAKLWVAPRPIELRAIPELQGFPISAGSFKESSALPIPWQVQVRPSSTFRSDISASIRLHINLDLPVSKDILDGSIHPTFQALLVSDVYHAVLDHLARNLMPEEFFEVHTVAQEFPQSMASFAVHISQTLGLDLDRALNLAEDDPLRLSEFLRVSQRFGEGEF